MGKMESPPNRRGLGVISTREKGSKVKTTAMTHIKRLDFYFWNTSTREAENQNKCT